MTVLAQTHSGFGALLIVLFLATLVLFVFVIIDMVRRPQWQWQQAGSNKAMWIVLEIALLVLFGFLSIVSGIIYLAVARPKLIAAERSGPSGGGYGSGTSWPGPGYGGPPGGYGPPGGPYGGAPPGPYGSGSAGQYGSAPSPYPGTPPLAPGAPPREIPPSWQPDPSHRHELRYWDGTSWTEHVSDAGTQSTDPLEG